MRVRYYWQRTGQPAYRHWYEMNILSGPMIDYSTLVLVGLFQKGQLVHCCWGIALHILQVHHYLAGAWIWAGLCCSCSIAFALLILLPTSQCTHRCSPSIMATYPIDLIWKWSSWPPYTMNGDSSLRGFVWPHPWSGSESSTVAGITTSICFPIEYSDEYNNTEHNNETTSDCIPPLMILAANIYYYFLNGHRSHSIS